VTALSLGFAGLHDRSRPLLALWAMLVLSLPVVSSLQFYLGIHCARLPPGAAARCLRVSGLDVGQAGCHTYLAWPHGAGGCALQRCAHAVGWAVLRRAVVPSAARIGAALCAQYAWRG